MFDYQLRDHFSNVENLYMADCKCTNHRHNRNKCYLTSIPLCTKCERNHIPIIDAKSMYFHPEGFTKKLGLCCAHWHTPPCLQCLPCKTNNKCVVTEPFLCHFTTRAVCCTIVDKLPHTDIYLSEHYYSMKTLDFFICIKHPHFHTTDLQQKCIIHTEKCCEEAIFFRDYLGCFIITTTNGGKNVEYTVYDPSLWRKQSTNQFLSFLRAVIALPDSVALRYQLFETSKFEIANLKRYKSGKDSIIRTAVIGFETQGVYQTSTISSRIPYNQVFIPQNIYRQLVNSGYDVTIACVKRDPSILPTCLYVCLVRPQPDPNKQVITISDQLSRGLNQDQDGDKNVLYFLRRFHDGWDMSKTYHYNVSRLELGCAMHNLQTLIGKPRYIFSENTLQYLYNNRGELTQNNNVLRRCFDLNMTTAHMNDVFASYHAQSYPKLQNQLMSISMNPDNNRYITIFDLYGEGKQLQDIIDSKAKGSQAMFDLFRSNLKRESTIGEAVPTMIDLCNKYIKSSQELSKNGRKQFVTLYASQDLVSFNGDIYLNKLHLANMTKFSPAITFMHNAGSLLNFVHDLIEL